MVNLKVTTRWLYTEKTMYVPLYYMEEAQVENRTGSGHVLSIAQLPKKCFDNLLLEKIRLD